MEKEYNIKSLPTYMWCNFAARGLICRKRPHGENNINGLYMTQCVRCKRIKKSYEQYDPRMARLSAGWNMMYNVLLISVQGCNGRFAIPDINIHGYNSPIPRSIMISQRHMQRYIWHKGNINYNNDGKCCYKVSNVY